MPYSDHDSDRNAFDDDSRSWYSDDTEAVYPDGTPKYECWNSRQISRGPAVKKQNPRVPNKPSTEPESMEDD